MRDQENMADRAKSRIPIKWASAVSSWQHLAKPVMKQNYDQAWTHAKK